MGEKSTHDDRLLALTTEAVFLLGASKGLELPRTFDQPLWRIDTDGRPAEGTSVPVDSLFPEYTGWGQKLKRTAHLRQYDLIRTNVGIRDLFDPAIRLQHRPLELFFGQIEKSVPIEWIRKPSEVRLHPSQWLGTFCDFIRSLGYENISLASRIEADVRVADEYFKQDKDILKQFTLYLYLRNREARLTELFGEDGREGRLVHAFNRSSEKALLSPKDAVTAVLLAEQDKNARQLRLLRPTGNSINIDSNRLNGSLAFSLAVIYGNIQAYDPAEARNSNRDDWADYG